MLQDHSTLETFWPFVTSTASDALICPIIKCLNRNCVDNCPGQSA